MSEQLPLIDVPAARQLTERQAAVLSALERTGEDGLEPSEAGAILHALKPGRWAHGPEERCLYCGRDGLAVLRRLRDLGLARYRGRMRVWQVLAKPLAKGETPRGMLRDDQEIPF